VVREPTPPAPRPALPALPGDPGALAAALEATGYLPDEGLTTAAYLALVMHRPLFLEGEAGVGKTALARALAEVTGRPLYRLQCYEGLEASQALYDWDFGRQLLHLRAAEAAHDGHGTAELEASLYDRRFLLARPLLQALEDSPSVLLVDEVDRADDEFEAFLLEVLSDFTISIPELGTVRAQTPPHRARHGARADAAARRPHLQPHPRGARRPQAPVPLPLAGAPGLRA
jgi:MoxR-like ATPase